jgi:hypothetical protein
MTRKGIVRAYLLTSHIKLNIHASLQLPVIRSEPYTVNSVPDKSRRNKAKWGCVGNVRSLRLPSPGSPRLLSESFGDDSSDGTVLRAFLQIYAGPDASVRLLPGIAL